MDALMLLTLMAASLGLSRGDDQQNQRNLYATDAVKMISLGSNTLAYWFPEINRNWKMCSGKIKGYLQEI